MANFNGQAYIEAAIKSILDQSWKSLEVLFVDDGSQDNSVEIAQEIAKTDERLRIFSGRRLGGPAPVRNFALGHAIGEWVAVVDSDDIIHPERLKRMLNAALSENADILIDDLLIFQDKHPNEVHTMLQGSLAKAACIITEENYIRANYLYGRGSALGYAKPLIRRSKLGNLRYNEKLKIGEDYDLILRLLNSGAKMHTLPELLYFYRKHKSSISHRLDDEALQSLQQAAKAELELPKASPGLIQAREARLKSIERAISFDRTVQALKQKRIATAIIEIAKYPSAMGLLSLPLKSAFIRLLPQRKPTTPDVAVIVRQRVVGPTNGSSTYLLAICAYLSKRGRKVSLLWPTSATFGRWPVLKLMPEMKQYDCHWHGALKVGSFVFVTNPKVYVKAFLTILEFALLKAKIIRARFVAPAQSALMAPYSREDTIFIAKRLGGARNVIADYVFCTPYLPYAIDTKGHTLVIMHDLFSSRPAQSGDKALTDYGRITFDNEIEQLRAADRVVAIQKEEGAIIESAMPGRVIIAPMAVEPVAAPSPGNDDSILFVGSNAAPNVLALQWFFQDIWPKIVQQRPQAIMRVAGNVSRNLTFIPAGVEALGVVPDLAPLYHSAGVIVSPLTQGSGLKIKFIEALSYGKASVVTSVTLQGVVDIASNTVRLADNPDAFASAVVGLLNDREARSQLGQAALDCVRSHFSADASFQRINDELS